VHESGLWTALSWTEYAMLGTAWMLAVTASAIAWRQGGARLPAVLAAVGLALLTTAIATPARQFAGDQPYGRGRRPAGRHGALAESPRSRSPNLSAFASTPALGHNSRLRTTTTSERNP
jgi:hypothetical protein